jgi:hypothetical protein
MRARLIFPDRRWSPLLTSLIQVSDLSFLHSARAAVALLVLVLLQDLKPIASVTRPASTWKMASQQYYTTMSFLNKEIEVIGSDDGAPSSTRLLDVGPTYACTPPLSLAPTTTVHLHHQLRPPHTEAQPPACAHRLPNHHCDCCLDTHTTSPTSLARQPHACMRPSVCSKQLITLWFLSRAVPTLEGEVVLN